MRYMISYFEDGRETACEHGHRDFSLARDIAAEAVQTGIAEEAEVRDGSGALLFRRPRTLQRA